ncbi:MAG TPA: LysR family transcriptional regulator [Caulobacteraceae bacterium]|nr:LysR family transcriptional regulator [Caulobacteraceae bacterium]
MSEAVRRLENRLGVRLLNRTTRSIAPTEAGAHVRAAVAGAGRGRGGPGCRQRLSRPAGRHAAAQRSRQCLAPGAAAGRRAVPERLSGHPAGSRRRGQLRGRAVGGLRRGHPL